MESRFNPWGFKKPIKIDLAAIMRREYENRKREWEAENSKTIPCAVCGRTMYLVGHRNYVRMGIDGNISSIGRLDGSEVELCSECVGRSPTYLNPTYRNTTARDIENIRVANGLTRALANAK